MADLFDCDGITWDDNGLAGIAGDGRRITIEISILTARYVACIPMHGRDVVTRRARRTLPQAQAAALAAINDGGNA